VVGQIKKLRSLRPYQHFCVWSFALSTTLPPLIRQKYGPMVASDYCYFPDSRDLRRLLFWIPVGICIFFSLWMFIYAAYYFLIRRSSLAEKSFIILRRLFVMVVVFNILWGLALGSRIYDAIVGNENLNFTTFANSLSGVCNLLIWGILNPKVLNFVQKHIYASVTTTIKHSNTETLLDQSVSTSIQNSRSVPEASKSLN